MYARLLKAAQRVLSHQIRPSQLHLVLQQFLLGGPTTEDGLKPQDVLQQLASSQDYRSEGEPAAVEAGVGPCFGPPPRPSRNEESWQSLGLKVVCARSSPAFIIYIIYIIYIIIIIIIVIYV